MTLAPGSQYTSDLVIMRALQNESTFPSIILTSDYRVIDLSDNPSASNGLTFVTLGNLLSQSDDPTGSFGLSASNSIYRPSNIQRNMPCLVIETSSIMQSTLIPNLSTQFVQIWAFDSEQSGEEVIVALSEIIKALLHNNELNSTILGYLNCCFVSESSSRNVVDYGWGKSLAFKVSVSSFGNQA